MVDWQAKTNGARLRWVAKALACAAMAAVCVGAARGQDSSDSERFEVRGVVVNSTTNEPVSGALVQLNWGRTAFSGADGTFVFTDVPRGPETATATKPGYFNEQQLGRMTFGITHTIEVPTETATTIKLVPEGLIFGEVKNEAGEPLEGVTVQAERWEIQNGRSVLQHATSATTDDEGKFRLAELQAGGYQVSFLPSNRRSGGQDGNALNKAAEGYGVAYYPGVAEAEDATTVQIAPGTRLQVSQTMRHERLFSIAGVVRGAAPGTPISVSVMHGNGEPVQSTAKTDQKTGEFRISGLAEGNYMLMATGQETGAGSAARFVNAMQPVHLRTDQTGVTLMLGRGISAELSLNDETRTDQPNAMRQVTVELNSKEFHAYTPTGSVPQFRNGQPLNSKIEEIPPGVYTVDVTPHFEGYVASVRCGGQDLLREALTVAQGAAVPPIEITVRNDFGHLTIQAKGNAKATFANVLLYAEELPQRSMQLTVQSASPSVLALPPGNYEVITIANGEAVEFKNPTVMEKYRSGGAAVSLQPGDHASVEVEAPAEEQP